MNAVVIVVVAAGWFFIGWTAHEAKEVSARLKADRLRDEAWDREHGIVRLCPYRNDHDDPPYDGAACACGYVSPRR
jgi:hypothetical protein